MKTCPNCDKKFNSRGYVNHKKTCGVMKSGSRTSSSTIYAIGKAIWDLLKSTWKFFSHIGENTTEYALFWLVKIPLAFICLNYVISAVVWGLTLLSAMYSLGSSWYHFWSFGSFADVGISLFGGIVSSADLLRTGMYKASSNVFGV